MEAKISMIKINNVDIIMRCLVSQFIVLKFNFVRVLRGWDLKICTFDLVLLYI